MNAITDGFGNGVRLTYAPLTDASVYTKVGAVPFPEMEIKVPLYVVKQYTSTDGIGGAFNVNETYIDARIHLQGRGFEGFSQRTEIDQRNGITTTTLYNQTFPKIGTVASVVARQPNGKKISETTYTYDELVSGTAQSNDRHFVYPKTIELLTYDVFAGTSVDGLGLARTVTTTTVDSYGTPTRVVAETYDMTDGGGSLVQTTTTDAGTPTNDTTYWCLGFVTQQQVMKAFGTKAPETRTVQFVKDSANPSLCRPSQKMIEPGNSRWTVTSTYSYDELGHIATETLSGSDIANRLTQTSYGTQGVFPVSITNAAGETVGSSYDYALGTVLTATDANQLKVSWQYDGFGRKTREDRPDKTFSTWTLYACNVGNRYCGDGLLRYEVLEQQLDADGNRMRYGVHLYDAMARSKYIQSESATGTMSNVATKYDQLGRVYQSSTPYFSGAPAYFTTYAYDLLGRPLSETRQVSESDPSAQSIQYTYAQLLQTTTDANGYTTQKTQNVLGQVVLVTDANNGVTRYDYDSSGNLVTMTDPAQNTTYHTYNIRGFKTSSSDPDMGYWSFDYYCTGELKSQTNAKHQIATFTYGDSTSYSSTNRNVGKLISVASPGGYAEATTYDSLGRSLDLTVTADSTKYVISSAYNGTTGLLDNVTYPSSTSAVAASRFRVQYDYAYGMLRAVKDYNTPSTVYWQQNAVDAVGHAIDEQYANGLHTYSNFDAITALISNRSAGDSARVQSLEYLWDKNGNLKERKDLNLSLTEDFTYDSINRLKNATMNGVQNLVLTYDASGNIQTKSDVGTYTYPTSGVHPHAVSAAGTNSYSYDANGNMITRNGSALTWFSYNLADRYQNASQQRRERHALFAEGPSGQRGCDHG